MNKSCCPEMSRDANGYNRRSRNKASHNAASNSPSPSGEGWGNADHVILN